MGWIIEADESTIGHALVQFSLTPVDWGRDDFLSVSKGLRKPLLPSDGLNSEVNFSGVGANVGSNHLTAYPESPFISDIVTD